MEIYDPVRRGIVVIEDPGVQDLVITLPANPAPDELPRFIKNVGNAGGILIVTAARGGTDLAVFNGEEVTVYWDVVERLWQAPNASGPSERPSVTPA